MRAWVQSLELLKLTRRGNLDVLSLESVQGLPQCRRISSQPHQLVIGGTVICFQTEPFSIRIETGHGD